MSISNGSASAPVQSTAAVQRSAWSGLVFFVALLAAVVFATAGSLRYWQGWPFWLSFTGWVVWITAYFLKRDPALVASRTNVGSVAESRPLQKLYQGFASVAFMATMFVPALDYRLGWSNLPTWVAVVGLVLVNEGMAGSLWGLIASVFLALFIILRLLDEERALQCDLVGYPEYMLQTRYRLLPGVW